MKRYFSAVLTLLMLVFCSAHSLPAKRQATPRQTDKGILAESILAGSEDDPFRGTSWESKGATILEFDGNGKVAFGYSTFSYTVAKTDGGYKASLSGIKGTKNTFTIADKAAKEGIFSQTVRGHGMDIPCTRIK